MKMNKLVKGLLVGFIALQMVGCEEAKEVENIEVQDTKPFEENVGNLGGEYYKFCEYCGNGIFNEKFGEEEYNELIQATYDKLAKLDMNKEDEREKYFYTKRNLECQIKYNGCTDCTMVEDFLLECHNVGFKMKGAWVDEHLKICKATHTNVENLPTEEPKVEEKVEAPVVKEEPKKETCPMCLEEGNVDNMVRIGEAYYHQGCYEEPVASAKADEYCYYCNTDSHNGDKCPVKYNCVYCGKTHGIADSYYNEDGMSACSEACFNAYMGVQLEEVNNAKCENCGHDVSDVIDNAGGYWCEACDYVK